MFTIFKQGSIFWYDFGKANIPGVIQHKRPCIIVSNNIFNSTASVVNIVPLSTQEHDSPVHVQAFGDTGRDYGYALCEQVVTVSKSDLFDYTDNVALSVATTIFNKLNLQFSLNT